MPEVRLMRREGVAVITLAAPERRNAFTPGMVAELVAACDEVDRDESLGAPVVTRGGEAFLPGAPPGNPEDAGEAPLHPAAAPRRARPSPACYRTRQPDPPAGTRG